MKQLYFINVIFILFFSISKNTFSQEHAITHTCKMPITDEVRNIYVPMSDAISSRMTNSSSACSEIIVNYVGFDAFPEARAAFERAVEIWENVLDSPVPIRVRATFDNLGTSTLGSARPETYLNVPGQPANVLYGAALAEQLIGEDRNGPSGTSNDIVCNFNNQTDWSYDADPTSIVGTNKFDFTTVVLHELGHGLGFAGFGGQLNDGSGALRRNSTGSFFSASDGFVSIWDTFTIGRDVIDREFPITNDMRFPDPSNTLLGAFTNENLTCNSPEAIIENGGDQPKFFAPTTFNSGSSYSHWDESTFNSTTDALMTPQVAREEVILDVGSITQGFMKDMGWVLCQDTFSNEGFDIASQISISQNPFSEKLNIYIPSSINTNEFNISLVNINGKVVSKIKKVPSNNEIIIKDLDYLESAIYFLRIECKEIGLNFVKKVIKKDL